MLEHMHKRLAHLEDKILQQLEQHELKEYNKNLVKHPIKVKLDSINKKKLSLPHTLYPLKQAPIEWWYCTGHLQSSSSHTFGYEFCMFKFNPYASRFLSYPLSKFIKKQFLVLHCAITDIKNKKFIYHEESSILKKQSISYNNLHLSFDNSTIKLNNNIFHITTKNKNFSLNFKLSPLKPLIKHFHSGFAIMYSPPEHRTYYLSYPRLKTTGKILLNNKVHEVEGLSWFDHQKMNNPPRSPLKGWDWFSIMFADNTELMIFLLKTKKGLLVNNLGGTYINKHSQLIPLKSPDIHLKNLSSWTSPHTKITYPQQWQLKIPKLKINIIITPTISDQELGKNNITPIAYWEGSCTVQGKKNNNYITGQSYVELVGYDQRLSTRLFQAIIK
ncbi:hypothetical protein HYX11_02430 [Candidatus Woesearchaeota archaeon]|nr:hypothetical protein [Candidatus Woesearchaeota archaeon]